LLVHNDLLVFTSIFSLSILMRVQNRCGSCQYFRAETKEQSWEAAAITDPASERKITQSASPFSLYLNIADPYWRPANQNAGGGNSPNPPCAHILPSSDLWRLINGCQPLQWLTTVSSGSA